MQVNFRKNSNNNLFINTNDKAIFLFLGLALWIFIPILGIFPLLFFVHLNRKQNSKFNLLVLLLVILTITVFVSSVDIISDLAVYIVHYEELGTKNPFEISGGQGFEFILWLVSYPIYIISHGSRYAFIFFWSFVFNTLTFLVITKGFSPRNYGLISLFVASTSSFIIFQGFLVRQYLATVIFLIAVINIDKKFLMWGLYLISLLTHMANLIYLPILLLYNKTQFLKTKIVKIFMLTAGIILPFSNTILVNLVSNIGRYLPSPYDLIILRKVNFYALNINNGNSFNVVTFIEHFTIFLAILFLLKNKTIQPSRDKVMQLLYLMLLFLMIIGRDIYMFSHRFAFILFSFGGLFYYFLIECKWKIFKKEFLLFALVLNILYFGNFLYDVNVGSHPFTYLDGNVFNSSIFDYIEIVHDGFTNDVKIKDIPNRTFI